MNILVSSPQAFDTVDHIILLYKLYNYGIRGIAHDILKSYLSIYLIIYKFDILELKDSLRSMKRKSLVDEFNSEIRRNSSPRSSTKFKFQSPILWIFFQFLIVKSMRNSRIIVIKIKKLSFLNYLNIYFSLKKFLKFLFFNYSKSLIIAQILRRIYKNIIDHTFFYDILNLLWLIL